MKASFFATVAGGALCLLQVLAASAADMPVYHGLKSGEPMKSWLVLKPIPIVEKTQGDPDDAAQERAFAKDWLTDQGGEAGVQPRAGAVQTLGAHKLKWQLVDSKADSIDLYEGDNKSDFSIAYAWAQVEMPQSAKVWLAVRSDDAIKVWLNGKLVHENWITRPVADEEDVIPVEFQSGTNRLLLKIQNVQGGWGFGCRLATAESLADKFVWLALAGDVETLQRWLDHGLDINRPSRFGLTAVQAARLHGQTDAVDFLASRGADIKAELPSRDKLVDALFSELTRTNQAGLAVLVARDGKILFERGYGWADRARHEPVTPQTKFRIGSITKQFTAAAILKLQEAGKLSVRDPLSKFIPDFRRGGEVTLHHLLTHTSGIHDYTHKPGFFDTITTPAKPEDLINSFKNDPHDFDPGKQWRYNNEGYFLLGYLVEKVSGQTYHDFLKRSFFDPLGMTNTGVYRAGLKLEHEARGYQYEAGKFRDALNWDMSRAGGAGALYSTIEDLFRWNEGIFNGKVLSEASLKAAFTPVKTDSNQEDAPGGGYGYGWGLSRLRGAQMIGHGGGLHGFITFLLRLPREHFTVAILANAYVPSAPGVEPDLLALIVTEAYLGESLAPSSVPRLAKGVSIQALDAVAGRYDCGGATLTVERRGSHLYAQLIGQPKEIFPASETNFFWKLIDAQVTFVKDQNGKVVKAIFHPYGNTLQAPRIE